MSDCDAAVCRPEKVLVPPSAWRMSHAMPGSSAISKALKEPPGTEMEPLTVRVAVGVVVPMPTCPRLSMVMPTAVLPVREGGGVGARGRGRVVGGGRGVGGGGGVAHGGSGGGGGGGGRLPRGGGGADAD